MVKIDYKNLTGDKFNGQKSQQNIILRLSILKIVTIYKQIYLVKNQSFKEIKKVTGAILRQNSNRKIRYNYPQLIATSEVLELDWL